MSFPSCLKIIIFTCSKDYNNRFRHKLARTIMYWSLWLALDSVVKGANSLCLSTFGCGLCHLGIKYLCCHSSTLTCTCNSNAAVHSRHKQADLLDCMSLPSEAEAIAIPSSNTSHFISRSSLSKPSWTQDYRQTRIRTVHCTYKTTLLFTKHQLMIFLSFFLTLIQ